LANRWQQYSPGPFRRLKKFFSVGPERRHDDWDAEGEDTRRQESVNVDDARNYVRSVGELPIATVSEDTFTESPEDTNGVDEIHRDIVAAKLIISDHSDKCSQDLKNESSIDSSNISNIHSFTFSNPTSLRFILLIFSHLYPGLPSVFITFNFPTENLYVFLFTPMLARLPGHLILFNFVIPILFGEDYKFIKHFSSASCYFILFLTNILLSTLLSNSLFSSHNGRGQVSYTYKTTSKIIDLNFYGFRQQMRRQKVVNGMVASIIQI
jgi:hypothetical protein